MTSLLVIALGGLPTPLPFQPPLAEFSVEILQDSAVGAPEGLDSFLPYGDEKCPTKAISTSRALGGALMALERTQAWLGQNPKVEAKLFKKDTLADVKKHLTYATPVLTRQCKAATLIDEWKWPGGLSSKLCAPPKLPIRNEAWLAAPKGATAAAVRVQSAKDPCQPRVSIALFDSKGKNRLVVNADFGGSMSATVVGDTCQIELTYDPTIEAFKPEWKACKG